MLQGRTQKWLGRLLQLFALLLAGASAVIWGTSETALVGERGYPKHELSPFEVFCIGPYGLWSFILLFAGAFVLFAVGESLARKSKTKTQ